MRGDLERGEAFGDRLPLPDMRRCLTAMIREWTSSSFEGALRTSQTGISQHMSAALLAPQGTTLFERMLLRIGECVAERLQADEVDALQRQLHPSSQCLADVLNLIDDALA